MVQQEGMRKPMVNEETIQTVETTEAKAPTHRMRKGRVVSISGNKTISVQVDNQVRHRQYGKYVSQRTKLAVHDEAGVAKVNDLVEVVSCRPISKKKAHRLLRVTRQAEVL